MKNTLITTLLCFILGGCATPNPHVKAYVDAIDGIAVHERNDSTKIDSLEFKHALIYTLPMKEKVKFDNIVMNADYQNQAWDQFIRREGFNSLAMGSTGVSPNSSTGSAIGLGLSLVDSYLESRPISNHFGILYAKVPLGSKEETIKKVYLENVFASKKAVLNMADEFGYDVTCTHNCDNGYSTYLLNLKETNTNPSIFKPQKIVVTVMLDKFELSPSKVTQKIIGSNGTYQSLTSDRWDFMLAYVRDDKEVTYDIGKVKDGGDEHEVYFPYGYDLLKTATGRNMLRSIGKELPFWVYYNDESMYDFAIYKGQSYAVYGTSSMDNLKGYTSTN
jgi:hypothetical protein